MTAVNKESFIEAVICRREDEFDRLLTTLAAEMKAKAKSKVILGYKWVADIHVLCTMCNLPSFLKKINIKLGDSFKPGTLSMLAAVEGKDVTVQDLSKALNYDECWNKLIPSYENASDRDDLPVNEYGIYEGILTFHQKHLHSFSDITISCLRRLHEQNCDVTARGPSGTTVLHQAFIHQTGPEITQILLDLGADVNAPDSFCVTPFAAFMHKLKYYNDQRVAVSILKVLLCSIPSITLNESSVMQALQYDLALHQQLGTSDNDSSSHLNMLLWLHKAGFKISLHESSLMYESCLGKLLPLYASNGENFESVQSLKILCRTAIRTIYPGSSLHTAVNNAEWPDSIKDFILIKELLSQN